MSKYLKTFKWLGRLLRNRDFVAFMVFFIISSFIWMLNKLRETYTVDVVCSYTCINAPQRYIIETDSLDDLHLQISGDGFNLIKMHMFNTLSNIEVDVLRMSRYQSGGSRGAYFIPNRYFADIAGHMPSGIKLVDVPSDTIFIPFLNNVRKFLPVKTHLKVSVDKQYMFSNPISVEPDSVWVSGTNNYIDSMTAVYTKPFSHSPLRDSMRISLNFDVPKQVKVGAPCATINFCVEPTMERTIDVPVVAHNLGNEYVFRSFPISVRVNMTVGFNSFEQIDENSFAAFVDFSNISIDKAPAKMKVKLITKSQKVINVTYSPIFVEYILERKKWQ